jgi:hypothetical protein
MPGINLRNLSADEHRQAKTAAAIAGETLEQFAATALRERAHRYYPQPVSPPAAKAKSKKA